MIKFSLQGLRARKLRTALTALGVVLGVALITGTYVLTDSVSTAFDSIFKETYRQADAAITGKSAVSLGGDDAGSAPPSFAQGLLRTVSALPEVRAADGAVSGEAHLIGKDGKAISFGGAPNLGFSVNPEQPAFNTLTLVSGAWPGADEVVIDTSTVDKKDLAVGETIGVQSQGPVERLRISGVVKFGKVSSIGGATIAGFDLATAQRLFDKAGELDQILMAAKPGVSPDQLVTEVRKILPRGTQARTAAEQADEDAEDTAGFVSFLQTFLLAFGGVALFVGSFVIANSLSITIAQRSREFATLRTLGASRRQVLGTVILEALAIGATAALAGLLLGLALAKGLFALFDAVGLTLPNNGLVFQTRTIVVALLVGTLVTVLASLRPAVRATRVPPIAAVREGAHLPPGRFHRFRGAGAVLVIVVGFAALLTGLFVDGLETAQVLTLMLGGALLAFIGVALFASRVVRPLAVGANPVARWTVVALSVLIWPFFTLPFWLTRYGAWGPGAAAPRFVALLAGTVLNPLTLILVAVMSLRRAITAWRPEWPVEFPGVLAERPAVRIGGENSRRDPQRTAATAAALMIGLALVTLVAALAAGLIKPFEDAVDSIFTGDYAVTAQNDFDPIPTSAAVAAAKTPGVESITSVRFGTGQVFGDSEQITAVDAQAPNVLTFDWTDGSQAVLGRLGSDGAIVADDYAADHHLRVGSPLTVLTPSGKRLALKIAGIFDPPTGGSPFGVVTISTSAFDRNYEQAQDLFAFVRIRGGVTAANTKALNDSLASFPTAKAVTRDEFKDNQVSGITDILNILYVLLALSVVVSFIGIVNTLVLTVYERTRELGMLRAIGMTRRQTRQMIRHESVVTALIGALLGIVLGLILAGLLSARLDFIDFVLPIPQLVIFGVVAVAVGVVAAVLPARRAARLDPLRALQYE